MAVSFVSQSQTGTASITLPSGILAGDFICLYAYRNTTTAPSLSTGYTPIFTQSANSNSMQAMFKKAVGTESGTSVGSTNANVIQCAVYRGVSRIGNSNSTTNASGATTTISAITTMQLTDSSSWVVACAGSKQTTSMGTPSGTTLRGTVQAGTTSMALISDTNAGVASWSGHTSTNGTSAVGAGGAFELVADGTTISGFSDPFNQTSLNTTNWSQVANGSAVMSYSALGAVCTFPAASTASTLGQLLSNSAYSLTNSTAYLDILTVPVPTTSADGEFRLQVDINNFMRWVYEGGSIFAQYTVAGVKNTPFSVAYSAVTHKYWRISESSGTVSWDTSPDGTTWTSQATVADPIVITALQVLIAGSCFQAEISPGTYSWNNFNTSTVAQVKSFSTLAMMGVG